MREILKVRKVGGTLVVTLTQGVLEEIPLEEGDRVLIEALPPGRILIRKEEKIMATTRRTELEIEALDARRTAIESDMKYRTYQYNSGMPCDPGMDDSSIFELAIRSLEHDRNKVAAEIAQKRLELFDLQGT